MSLSSEESNLKIHLKEKQRKIRDKKENKRSLPQFEPGKLIEADFASFKTIKLLGQGGFGAVYLVEEINSRTKYALKTELGVKEGEKRIPCLPWEETILLKIQEFPDENKKKHFIKIVDRTKGPNYNVLIMTLVGKSLNDLRKISPFGDRLSQNTCWRIAYQTLEALECFHEAGFVHKDIKPHNYTKGSAGQDAVIFLLDFGLARCYTGIKYKDAIKDTNRFAGTFRYCPRAAHAEIFQYPKDDLESWIFSYFELMDPEALTWKRIENKEKMFKKKMAYLTGRESRNVYELIPIEYKSILRAVGNLSPELVEQDYKNVQKVPYSNFYNMLTDLGKVCRFSHSEPMDWENPKFYKNFPHEMPENLKGMRSTSRNQRCFNR
ncbi:Protein kinase domain and Serine/threonine-/dual specificity protein kinase, catalytic domain and Protein kinase-like domain-containing protein [Strongyloides ratti]|uniref:Protein kinase domain and Serine/threonine-/dual specificity protein kinase, catalytic domain and Protein kinase-like domain-containing protein n=1 Tax=Strongyloides ratti TaxID=34506 RepID=A0A090L652_STRRB|nr:Protein kinase domain and Serine/threonine-/dual specificity protein kinase, catalytic domain and Protein kinase-like domain-containing protein [Strongyloides ratti]CEF65271.1 Protein kinase domain and Serine/threonine-/dual specificity protein kinase, catalytic domain and Protein kinase-like domain-containing protein [Strongyloides ratti]